MDKSPQNEGIFERSLSISMLSLPPQSRHKLARTLSNCSLASNGYAIPTHHNTEDFVAPVLDTATEILYNPKSDLNNVNIVCCYENDEEEECDGSCTEKDSDDDSTLNQLKLPNQQQHHHHHHHHHPKKPRSRSRSRSSICKSLMSSLSNTAAGLQSQTFPLSAHSNGPTSPSVRSSKSNVSLPQHQHPSGSASPDTKTIPFYSFADMLDNERVEQENDQESDELSPVSPPEFRGFSFSQGVSVQEDENILHKRSNSSHSPPLSTDGFTTLSVKEYISKLA